MNQWINESMNQWISEPMTQWLSETMNRWLSDTMNQWINESMHEWFVDESMNQWMNVVSRVNEALNQWINAFFSSSRRQKLGVFVNSPVDQLRGFIGTLGEALCILLCLGLEVAKWIFLRLEDNGAWQCCQRWRCRQHHPRVGDVSRPRTALNTTFVLNPRVVLNIQDSFGSQSKKRSQIKARPQYKSHSQYRKRFHWGSEMFPHSLSTLKHARLSLLRGACRPFLGRISPPCMRWIWVFSLQAKQTPTAKMPGNGAGFFWVTIVQSYCL